ncbi:CoA transferase [Paractinoplanes deccanensis]|uniref:CoA transferase n=1 Tax=Paractinoplanes deccanensis TaxID=113561 RepID=A0ABQ3XY58_9ACTN|nr:CoA transferase [Actinoplanes deccanensis]GID72688.1 CoA transferase [Actinoplanes deccanensis]
MKPLEDIRILAIEQYGAGPFGTLHLVDLGAEVIKIEDPATGGEISRRIAPMRTEGDSVFFQTFNRGKRSIALDLANDSGRAVFARLVAVSDVVFSNLRADVPGKLGLCYADLAAHNPRIVCANLSAFGRGSREAEPGYDYVLQAETGWMHLTGEPDGPPAKSGLSLVDYIGGLVAALSLTAAVHAARRTGRGCDCDLSLYDAAVSMLTYPAAWHLNGDVPALPTRHSSHPSVIPFGAFPTADGWLVVACAKEHFWRRLTVAVGRPGLAEDERYRDMEARLRHRDDLMAALDDVFATAETAHWVKVLKEHGVPCSPVRTVAEALEDPYCAARDMLVDLPHPHWGRLRLPATAVRVGDARPADTAAPALGADTGPLLRTLLGLSGEGVAALRAAGAFG